MDDETFLDLVDPLVDSTSDPSYPKFAIYLLRKLWDLSVSSVLQDKITNLIWHPFCTYVHDYDFHFMK